MDLYSPHKWHIINRLNGRLCVNQDTVIVLVISYYFVLFFFCPAQIGILVWLLRSVRWYMHRLQAVRFCWLKEIWAPFGWRSGAGRQREFCFKVDALDIFDRGVFWRFWRLNIFKWEKKLQYFCNIFFKNIFDSIFDCIFVRILTAFWQHFWQLLQLFDRIFDSIFDFIFDSFFDSIFTAFLTAFWLHFLQLFW